MFACKEMFFGRIADRKSGRRQSGCRLVRAAVLPLGVGKEAAALPGFYPMLRRLSGWGGDVLLLICIAGHLADTAIARRAALLCLELARVGAIRVKGVVLGGDGTVEKAAKEMFVRVIRQGGYSIYLCGRMRASETGCDGRILQLFRKYFIGWSSRGKRERRNT